MSTEKLSNEAEPPALNKAAVTCCGFSVGDLVNTPYGEGEVWKVTEKSVHVKHWHGKKNCKHDWLFSKYLIATTHHSQNPVSVLSHCR